MSKKKITRQLENFRIYKDLYGKPCKRDRVAKVVFLIQMLLTFGSRCNRCVWDIRLKMLRLPNFNMLFQLVLTKFFKSELFSCLPKVDHVIKSCKEPILQQKSNQQVTKKIKTLAVRTGVRAYTDATLLTTSAYLKQCKSFHHLHNLLCMSTNMTQ